MQKESYTQWAIKYPWHVSGDKQGQYPKDTQGNCTCECEYCAKMYEHKANTKAHMH